MEKIKNKKRKIILPIAIVAVVIGLIFTVGGFRNSFKGGKPSDSIDKTTTLLCPPQGATPTNSSPLDVLFYTAYVISECDNYHTETQGKTETLGVEQKFSSKRAVVGNRTFKQSVSYSTFVKLGEQRYSDGNLYAVRKSTSVKSLTNVKWKDYAEELTEQEYNEKFGCSPVGICSYVLNANSVTDAYFVKEEDGLYVFGYSLHKNNATPYILYEMKHSAGTSTFPKFESCKITVRIDENFKIYELTVSAKYKVDKLGGVDCEEHTTEKFFYGDAEIPDIDLFLSLQ